ncbi:hypothetical protein K3G63_19455 [Hymenobacter sp. HSC-4F20]|uniref:hypothetical protein n=1 Tax=Hymenobacter sp. HSC-4F20 TaxID=2864135 RepID=UPI001C735113|nr:hypothetical protein [Hymenobacter sp. HSC-4F20]MBX0292630.1 hypothetical protein [Hymenobacter sp. HSC-4F20]
MIHNYLRNFQLAQRVSLVFVPGLVSGALPAQAPTGSLLPRKAPAFCHVLRLAIGGILIRNYKSGAVFDGRRISLGYRV